MKKTLEDIDVKGKKVFVRADFNVPLDEHQNITNDKRIRATLPTIEYLLEHGAAVILASHLGRPKGQVKPELSTKPVAARLSELLKRPVAFAEACVINAACRYDSEEHCSRDADCNDLPFSFCTELHLLILRYPKLKNSILTY